LNNVNRDLALAMTEKEETRRAAILCDQDCTDLEAAFI